MHRQQTKKFSCQFCEKEFTTASTRKNHEKTCEDEPQRDGNKQFKVCKTWMENSKFARHKKRHADYSRGRQRERERTSCMEMKPRHDKTRQSTALAYPAKMNYQTSQPRHQLVEDLSSEQKQAVSPELKKIDFTTIL
ncbi:uncharacterized protein LOC142349186 [Convolutriloba macropyga]|uniref:uncharacterized protein LOC142349186 n=1 Tax=Convolutriloba macropyga TaxID=536237 RepID=UPI003F5224FC